MAYGPWIKHNGKGCPCKGARVKCKFRTGAIAEGIAGARGGDSWDWNNYGWVDVIVKYQIWKDNPKGIEMLRELVNNPKTVKIEEDA